MRTAPPHRQLDPSVAWSLSRPLREVRTGRDADCASCCGDAALSTVTAALANVSEGHWQQGAERQFFSYLPGRVCDVLSQPPTPLR
jgi:hypothetical protein